MKLNLETNVLVRLIVGDDVARQCAVVDALAGAELVAVSVHAGCEFTLLLDQSYKVQRTDISAAIRRVLDVHNVVAHRPMIEAGLAMRDAGGDFADGVIAFDGQWLGGETLVSIDRQAVKLLEGQGSATLLMS